MIQLYLQNLKCAGCANTITKAIKSVEGTSQINIDIASSLVQFDAATDGVVHKVKSKLTHLGYPEINESNSMFLKAASYISCATGRLGKNAQ